MAIILGGITLHKDLRLEPELEMIPRRAVETMPVRNGPALRWEKELKDRPFDLIGGEDFAWHSLGTMQSVLALAVQDKWEGTLNLHGSIMTVYFRHADAPVLSFVPIPDYNYEGRAVGDLVCEVRIKLVWKVAA